MEAHERRNEEVLASRALAGDREALSKLYNHYFPRVYDLAMRVLHDPDMAADVAQDTFVKLLDPGQARGPHTSFRAWLYTIARNRAIDETRRGRRVRPLDVESTTPGEDVVEMSFASDADPESAVLDQEMESLVWDAAMSLRPAEYTLLDLHLRKQLTTDEISQVLGKSSGNVYTMLSRLRDALEGAVTALIVTRRGASECADLRATLGDAGNVVASPRDRRRVLRHLERCNVCQSIRLRYLSATQLFAGLSPVAPAAGFPEAVWTRIEERLDSGPGQNWGDGERGDITGQGTHSAGVAGLAISAAKILAATIGGFALILAATWGGMTAWGSGEIALENLDCPTFSFHDADDRYVSGALLLPNVDAPDGPIEPGAVATLSLPPGEYQIEAGPGSLWLQRYGLEIHHRLPDELTMLEWESGSVLGQRHRLSVERGGEHSLRFACGGE